MFDKHYIGLDLTGFEDNGQLDKVSRITLLVDDENAITAGDDTGLELTADCPHATQSMANALLASLKGYQYRMYGADSANIDPAAELGDGATAGGIYSTISRIDDDGSGYMGVAAPGEAEEKDEFPGVGPMTKEFNRKLAGVRSSITKTAEQIRLEVKDEVRGLETSITQTAGEIRTELSNTKTGLESTISQTAGEIRTEVKSVDGRVSTLSQTVNGIQTKVTGLDGNVSTLTQTATSLQSQITSSNGEISTLKQTATSLQSQITAANGNISTVTQTANKINWLVQSGTSASDFTMTDRAISLMAGNIDLTGYVTFSRLNSLEYDEDGNLKTIIDGNNLITGTVTASTIKGNVVQLLTGNGSLAAEFDLENSSSSLIGGPALNVTSNAVSIQATVGNVFLQAYSVANTGISSALQLMADLQNKIPYIQTTGWVVPGQNGVDNLGSELRMYKNVYAVSGLGVLSDRTKKKDINYDLGRYEQLFDSLAPCAYRFVDGERVHIGLIAQDVEEQMAAHGIDSMELAAFIKSRDEENGGYRYCLRYGEFISLLIDQVQKLKQRVKALEEAA